MVEDYDFLQRDKLKHLIGKDIIDLCSTENSSRRTLHLYIRNYDIGEGWVINKSMIEEVINTMQLLHVQNRISFNANFMNPICIYLSEYTIGHQARNYMASEATTGISWGKEFTCLRKLCRMKKDKDSIRIWAIFGDEWEHYALDVNGIIRDAWIPDVGG